MSDYHHLDEYISSECRKGMHRKCGDAGVCDCKCHTPEKDRDFAELEPLADSGVFDNEREIRCPKIS